MKKGFSDEQRGLFISKKVEKGYSILSVFMGNHTFYRERIQELLSLILNNS